MPGTERYDPSKPWMYKYDSKKNSIACDAMTFVDDIRLTAPDLDSCERLAHQIASRCNYLGQQDVARKRREPSSSPGMWCGSLVEADGANLKVYTSQEKWNRGRDIVSAWKLKYDELNPGINPVLNHKKLERDRGFMVHLGRTYSWIMPYLKGIHNSLESWRDQRDEDGWKYTDREWRELVSELRYLESEWDKSDRSIDVEAPDTVTTVPRMRQDVHSLYTLMESGEPPQATGEGWKYVSS